MRRGAGAGLEGSGLGCKRRLYKDQARAAPAFARDLLWVVEKLGDVPS